MDIVFFPLLWLLWYLQLAKKEKEPLSPQHVATFAPLLNLCDLRLAHARPCLKRPIGKKKAGLSCPIQEKSKETFPHVGKKDLGGGVDRVQ